MDVKKLDLVRLKDGRVGTVIEFTEKPLSYIIETREDMSLWPTVTPEEIAEIIHVNI